MNLNHLFLSSQVGPLRTNDGSLVLWFLSRKMLHRYWCARLYTKCMCISVCSYAALALLDLPCFTYPAAYF